MVQRDMDRLFGNLVRSMAGTEVGGGELALTPRLDISQTAGGLEIDAELPAATDECGPKSTPLHSHIKAERENEPKAPTKR